MAIVTFSGPIQYMVGSISKDSPYYYRRTPSGKIAVCKKAGYRAPKEPELTAEQIAEIKKKAATAEQKKRRERFARALKYHGAVICKYRSMIYQAMTKSQLAAAAGVSTRTLARWMQTPEMQALMQQYRIRPSRRKLPPVVAHKICEHFCIFPEELD